MKQLEFGIIWAVAHKSIIHGVEIDQEKVKMSKEVLPSSAKTLIQPSIRKFYLHRLKEVL